MKIFAQAEVQELQIQQTDLDLIEWTYEVLERELDHKYPHTKPVQRRALFDPKFSMHTLCVIAEWKEPVQ